MNELEKIKWITPSNLEKNTDTLIEQRKTGPHETLEFKLRKSMDCFSLNPPSELGEEKYTIAVTNIEVYYSYFNITEHNNAFTIYTPDFWQDPDTINKLEV